MNPLPVTCSEYAAAASRVVGFGRRFVTAEAVDPRALERVRARPYLNAQRDAGFYLIGLPGAAELRGLIALPGAPEGEAFNAARAAIDLGARVVECYEGPTRRFFDGLGFQEVHREPFSFLRCPPGWHVLDMGLPDIVVMALPLHGGTR